LMGGVEKGGKIRKLEHTPGKIPKLVTKNSKEKMIRGKGQEGPIYTPEGLLNLKWAVEKKKKNYVLGVQTSPKRNPVQVFEAVKSQKRIGGEMGV